jgi:hypothetical protein
LSILAAISFLTTLSDNFFLLQFTVPFLVFCGLFVAIPWRRKLLVSGVIFFSSVLGMLSYKVLIAHPTQPKIQIRTHDFLQRLRDISKPVKAVFVERTIYSVLFLAFLLLTLYFFVRFFLDKRAGITQQKITYLVIFSFLSSSATFFSLLVNDIPFGLRYILPLFFWPIIVVPLALAFLLKKKFFYLLGLSQVGIITLLGFICIKLVQNNEVHAGFYPEEISCIDSELQKEALTNGIAGYWEAKYIQAFSRRDIQLAQYDGKELKEQRWITSQRYFRETYDFALVTEGPQPAWKQVGIMSAERIVDINGAPKTKLQCGEISLYIYGKDKMRVA